MQQRKAVKPRDRVRIRAGRTWRLGAEQSGSELINTQTGRLLPFVRALVALNSTCLSFLLPCVRARVMEQLTLVVPATMRARASPTR